MDKYTNWYQKLILTRKERILPFGTYVEKHHIRPRSLGGSNDIDNLISLLPREHFIAHLLLARMHCGKDGMKMVHALRRMLTGGNGNRYIPNSRIYSLIRTLSMLKCSGENNPMHGRTGEKHPSYGRKELIYNEEFKAKISATSKGRIPWNKGLTGVQAVSDETKKKMSASGKGRAKTDEWKKKMKEIMKNKPLFTCPHCNKIGQLGAMTRWHFDQCKNKPLV